MSLTHLMLVGYENVLFECGERHQPSKVNLLKPMVAIFINLLLIWAGLILALIVIYFPLLEQPIVLMR